MSKYLFILLSLLAVSAFAAKPAECVVGGCSSQLCSDASEGPLVSTCIWTPAYGCYKKHGTCEAQPDGECGWTPTEELTQCLASPEDEFPL